MKVYVFSKTEYYKGEQGDEIHVFSTMDGARNLATAHIRDFLALLKEKGGMVLWEQGMRNDFSIVAEAAKINDEGAEHEDHYALYEHSRSGYYVFSAYLVGYYSEDRYSIEITEQEVL